MKARQIFVMVLVAATACAFAAAAVDEPVVEKKGKRRIWYTSDELKAELEYHWADKHLGDEWIILKLSMAGNRKGVTQVSRENVRLLTPGGDTVDLPSQSEFRRVSGSMRMGLDRTNAWQPPSSRFVGSQEPCGEWFFSPPGAPFHRDTVGPSAFQYCSGPLVFQLPGGVQPGRWVLSIRLEETTVKIPFVLGEEE